MPVPRPLPPESYTLVHAAKDAMVASVPQTTAELWAWCAPGVRTLLRVLNLFEGDGPSEYATTTANTAKSFAVALGMPWPPPSLKEASSEFWKWSWGTPDVSLSRGDCLDLLTAIMNWCKQRERAVEEPAATLPMVKPATLPEIAAPAAEPPPGESATQGKRKRMSVAEADLAANRLAAREPTFTKRTVHEWAKAIGCSPSTVLKTNLWKQTAELRGRHRAKRPRPGVFGMTAHVEANLAGRCQEDPAEKTFDDLVEEQEAEMRQEERQRPRRRLP
jgi:hypothetical protein